MVSSFCFAGACSLLANCGFLCPCQPNATLPQYRQVVWVAAEGPAWRIVVSFRLRKSREDIAPRKPIWRPKKTKNIENQRFCTTHAHLHKNSARLRETFRNLAKGLRWMLSLVTNSPKEPPPTDWKGDRPAEGISAFGGDLKWVLAVGSERTEKKPDRWKRPKSTWQKQVVD